MDGPYGGYVSDLASVRIAGAVAVGGDVVALSGVTRTPSGALGGRVFRSARGVGPWTRVPLADGDPRAVDLAATASRLYAATADGVYRSLDGGATWGLWHAEEGRAPLAVYGDGRGTLAVVSAASEVGVYDEDEGTWAWSASPVGAVLGVTFAPGGDVVVLSSPPSSAYRTRDGGAWDPVSLPTGVDAYGLSFAASGATYLIAADGLHVRDDGGAWRRDLDQVGTGTALETGDGVLVGGFRGVQRRPRGGGPWAPSNEGIDKVHALAIAPGPDGELAVSDFGSGRVWLRRSEGAPWAVVAAYEYGAALAFDAAGRLFVAPRSGDRRVVSTADGGATWEPGGSGPVDALHAVDGAVYALNRDGESYRWDPAARSWDPVGLGAGARHVAPAPGGVVAATSRGVFVSSGGGWTAAPGSSVLDPLGLDPYLVAAAAGSVFAYDPCPASDDPECVSTLYRSAPGGAWDPALSVRIGGVLGAGDALYVGGLYGVSASDDGGRTWRDVGPFAASPPEFTYGALAGGPGGSLFVGVSGRGVFRTAGWGMASGEGPGGADRGLTVRVSPNPARGPVRVEVRGPRPGPYAVEVYDALGRRVSAGQEVPVVGGEGSGVWDPRGLPRGLYLVRVTGPTGTVALPVTIH